MYVLAFGGTVLGAVAARRGSWRGRAVGFVIGHVYSLYAWLLWPALLRAAVRHVGRRNTWSKTNREPIAEPVTEPVAEPVGSHTSR